MQPLLEARNVSKVFGKRRNLVLSRVNLAVFPHSVNIIYGPQGSGKTTLLRILRGLLKPSYGVVVCSSKSVTARYLPRDNGLLLDLTMLENVVYFAKLHGLKLSMEELLLKYSYIVSYSGLDFIFKDFPLRVSLDFEDMAVFGFLLALVGDPDVIFLDDWTFPVNELLRTFTAKSFKTLTSHKKTTVVMTSSEEQEKFPADVRFYLKDGRIFSLRPPDEVLIELAGVPGLHLVCNSPVHEEDVPESPEIGPRKPVLKPRMTPGTFFALQVFLFGERCQYFNKHKWKLVFLRLFLPGVVLQSLFEATKEPVPGHHSQEVQIWGLLAAQVFGVGLAVGASPVPSPLNALQDRVRDSGLQRWHLEVPKILDSLLLPFIVASLLAQTVIQLPIQVFHIFWLLLGFSLTGQALGIALGLLLGRETQLVLALVSFLPVLFSGVLWPQDPNFLLTPVVRAVQEAGVEALLDD